MSQRRGRIEFGSNLTGLNVPDLDKLEEAVRNVMRTAGDFAKALWYTRAQDLGIRDSGAYLQGVQDATVTMVETTGPNGDLEIVFEITNTAPHAAIVEDGHAAFHLPDKVDWNGGKVRHTAEGKPYLRIPFGHAAFADVAARVSQGLTVRTLKRMMPAGVYEKAKQLAYTAPPGSPSKAPASRRRFRDTTPGPSIAGLSELSERWRGPRTVQGRDATGARLSNPAWVAPRYSGLIKVGRPGHASYMTIRTLTPDSAGWNIPSQLGHGVARQVAYALNGQGAAGDRFRDLLVETARKALQGGSP